MPGTLLAARLLFPALRWNDDSGYDHQADEIAEALRLGVGGFILFGGEAEGVRHAVAALRARASGPLLFASDLERGAGQQFLGCTPLPPAWALGSLQDLEVLWRAGELTAREARAVGVDWVYAPMADLGNEPGNPIVATRAFGADPDEVARAVVAWSLGCLAGGAVPCVKHFPGHGRTLSDSHIDLPVVRAGVRELASDLVPFAAAAAAGVPSMMSAHVAYPALDPDGTPATRSKPILHDLLRGQLGFQGLVVSDALIMEGAAMDTSEAEAALEAVRAGVDVLLYPRDVPGLAAALDGAGPDALPPERIREATARLDRMAALLPPRPLGADPTGGPEAERPQWGREEDRLWVRETALRTVQLLRGPVEGAAGAFSLVTIDDDLGSPYPTPDRSTFLATLRALGVDVHEAGSARSEGAGARIVALYADVRAWKGRVGLSEDARRRLREALAWTGPSLVVLFSHPWNGVEVPPPASVLCAWGGEPLMQEAAARAVAGLVGP